MISQMCYVGAGIGTNMAKQNAILTDLLLAAGAVLYCRTNVPTSLMRGETDNNVFGLTSNPSNLTLTSGGSSGGEGALIGMKGSPLGVGSDIGGSIRIPSAFNGLFGLKPSYNRMPYTNAMNSFLGQESICSVLGPLSRSTSGLRVFTKAVLDLKPHLYDPYVIEKSWDEAAYQLKNIGGGKKLCFAFIMDDGQSLSALRKDRPLLADNLSFTSLPAIPATTPQVLPALSHLSFVDWRRPRRH